MTSGLEELSAKDAGRRQFQARALAVLFGAGGVLGLLSVLVPHGPGVDETHWAINSACGFPVCAALFVLGARTRTWMVHSLLALGAAMVSLGLVFGGGGPTSVATSFLFVWVALYVSWCFSMRIAAAHILADAVMFAVVLIHQEVSGGPAIWLLVVGTVVVVSVVVTLMNRELLRVANRDALTGLPTRCVLKDAYGRETSAAQRRGQPFSLVMIDVDGLKAINDRDGHPEGDRLLADAAQAWRSVLRDSDLLVRFGGDEFVALLANCPSAAAEDLATRLRSAATVLCSTGVAHWMPGDELATMLARADADLYRAKRTLYSGRRTGAQ